jgi:bile acid-coenzyme A ligase
MGDLLAYHAARDPSKPAITFNEVAVSYAQLDAAANQRARHLAALGVRQDDVVTIAMPKSLAIYELLFALWKLGASPNLVSPKLPGAELLGIIELANPRVVIGPDPVDLPKRQVLGAGQLAASVGFSSEPIGSKTSANWKIMTSGGSTGRPKLIVDQRLSTHNPTLPVMMQMVGDTVINPGPLYHNAPFVISTHCLFTGGHLIEMDRFDALHALQLIERYRVAWVNFVPTMMHRIWRLPTEQRTAYDLSSLRVVFHMAAPCPVWLKEKWIEWLGPERIFELYGGAEGQGVTVITGEEWLRHRGSVGRIAPGSEMRILNEAGDECRTGDVGLIFFLPDAGRGATYRYIGAKAQVVGDWETLGDLGYVDEEGYLYLADRRTDLILSGGANIYPAEVEAALDAHPSVLSSIVVGLPDEDLGQRVHAIVQISPSSGVTDSNELQNFLSTRLVRYKIPRSFEFTSEFLRDDAGKARRSQLRDARIVKEEVS